MKRNDVEYFATIFEFVTFNLTIFARVISNAMVYLIEIERMVSEIAEIRI